MPRSKALQCESTQNVRSGAQKRPTDGVLLGVLKSVETELRARGLLPPANGYPLWFVAETERNVFLWRKGRSLIDQSKFEFWVRPQALIEKRLAQIRSGSSVNPFLNPAWEGMEDSAMGVDPAEVTYLETLQDRLGLIASHAEALSHVSSLVMSEITTSEREVVILPSAGAGK